jgi:glutathione-independent formaldehyde dehydrogenase
MSKNRGVVHIKPRVVEVQDIADPKFEDPRGRKINRGVPVKFVIDPHGLVARGA